MSESVLLTLKLKKLRLSGIAEILENRLQEAINKRWSHSEFLDLLLTDELDKRDERTRLKRFNQSGLDPNKALEFFDFSFNPKINEGLIRELATCNFIDHAENLFFLGPSGVGKSHLAQAVGHEFCRRNKEVFFYQTAALLKWIHSGRGDGTYSKRLSKIMKCPLLILDDFGLQPISDCQQDTLYEIICSRYENVSTIITSNRDIGEWQAIFANSLIGSAAVDRLIHKAMTVLIEGTSYRVAEYKSRNKKKNKEK